METLTEPQIIHLNNSPIAHYFLLQPNLLKLWVNPEQERYAIEHLLRLGYSLSRSTEKDLMYNKEIYFSISKYPLKEIKRPPTPGPFPYPIPTNTDKNLPAQVYHNQVPNPKPARDASDIANG